MRLTTSHGGVKLLLLKRLQRSARQRHGFVFLGAGCNWTLTLDTQERMASMVLRASQELEKQRPILEDLQVSGVQESLLTCYTVDIQARNRACPVTSEDDAARRLVNAASAMVACDVLLGLLRASPSSTEMADSFVRTVPGTCAAVQEATAAMADRERAASDAAETKLREARQKLAVMQKNVKMAGSSSDPPDEHVLVAIAEVCNLSGCRARNTLFTYVQAKDALMSVEKLRIDAPRYTVLVERAAATVDAAEEALNEARRCSFLTGHWAAMCATIHYRMQHYDKETPGEPHS